MPTAEQWSALPLGILLAHLLGDYVFQTDWMAQKKTSAWLPAIVHGFIYTVVYVLMLWVVFGFDGRTDWSSWPLQYWLAWLGLELIWWTHVVIDHWRLVKHSIWAINQVGPRASRYSHLEAMLNNGYSKDSPVWMRTWLMIVVDNAIHLVINSLVIYLMILPWMEINR